MFDWLRRLRRPDPPRTNEEWLDALREEGARRDTALAHLRDILVRGLRAALASRVPRHADTLAEDVAQEALLKILDKRDTFRGESRFTTWAQKIAIRLALSKLRRKRWEDVSLDELESAPSPGEGLSLELVTQASSPEEETLRRQQMEQIRRVMDEELSERQRRALMAVTIVGMPVAEVARRMDTNRNALYKLLYDARQRMKQGFEARGLSLDDLLSDE